MAVWGGLGAQWSTSMKIWSDWAGAWTALMRQRGGPAADRMLQRLFNPEAWMKGRVPPMLEEVWETLALPRFADLPNLDGTAFPSMMPTLELTSLTQQYLQLSAQVWVKACQRFQAEAAEIRRRGERLESAGRMLDLWNSVLDRTLMEFNRSAEFGELQRRFLRAAMRQRLEFRRLAERAAEVADMPTRKEMDDVYRRLHDLLREVHGLRRELRALKDSAGPPNQAGELGRNSGRPRP